MSRQEGPIPALNVHASVRGFEIGGRIVHASEPKRPIPGHRIASQHLNIQQESNPRSCRPIPRRGFKLRKLARIRSSIRRRC